MAFLEALMSRYFVHHPPTPTVEPFYWRSLSLFADQPIHINLNLLAHVLGDSPTVETVEPGGGRLVPVQDYRTEDSGQIVVRGLQPFAYTMPGDDPNRPRAFGIGPKLQEFLDDPVGEPMGLSLPLYDAGRLLGKNGGGWFKDRNDETSFHAATDFMGVFDVCAAQAGTVCAARGQGVVLEHQTSAGRVFRTVYQHMDAATIQVSEGNPVRRGQLLGRPRKDLADPHLHFGVAVQPPAISGGPPPGLPAGVLNDWYFIDPWGIYDYRASYVPDDGFQSSIENAERAIQWHTQPLFKTIPIARTTEGYSELVRVQVRARGRDNFGGSLPDETEQFAVWLDGDDDFFLVPYRAATDRTTELNLEALLREAFVHGKSVKLEYRYVGDLRLIMAAWVNA
jgi:hypothetical protein